ncbi:MAG: porin family protein [Bacteroidales bacterium]|jgi:hypothetical protein|nr:porin family protein [Bacteroidales bacterium]
MKIRALSVLIIIFVFVLSSSGQITLGPKIGLNLSRLSANLDEVTTSIKEEGKSGFQIGAFARVGGKTYLQPELLYSVRGGSYSYSDAAGKLVTGSYDFNSIDIPVLVGYKIINVPFLNMRIFAGPIISFKTKETSKFTIDGIEQTFERNNLSSANWGANIGAGIDFLMFTFDVRYELGVKNISGETGESLKNNIFNISLGWKIL